MSRLGRHDGESPSLPGGPLDDRALCALLLHPDVTAEQTAARAAHRRRLRVGLTVATMSGIVLAPAVSLADDTLPPAPTVTASCQITGALADGTPSGLLDDGSVCVQAVSPAAPDDPSPPSAEEPAASTPPDPAPSAPDPEPTPAPPAATQPSSGLETPTAEAPDSAAHLAARPAGEQTQAQEPASAAGSPRRTQTVAIKPATKRPDATRARADRPGHRDTSKRHAKQAPDAAPTAAPVPLPGALQGPLGTPFFVTDAPVIPQFLIEIYKQAGRHYRVPWPILAAINEIETDFGRNVAVSTAGATGWMQFMPGTWRSFGVDADHNGVKDPDNPRDAIFAAARYLKASGAKHNMRRAIFAYNHAGWYVDSILLRAERIAADQREDDRRLRRLFVAGERRLERQVLTDPRITLYECGRQDVAAHRIDRRILILLRFLAWSGLSPTVTSLECGHGEYTSSGNVSEHASGNGVDIAAINGVPILGNQGAGSITEATIRELLTLRGALAPHQIISLMSFAGTDNTLSMGDHADHIHVGFRPLAPITH